MATNKNPHSIPSKVEFHPQRHHHHHPLPSEDHPAAAPCHRHHHHPQGPMQPPSSLSSPSSAIAVENLFRNKDVGVGCGVYDLGELDQALFVYLDGHDPSSSTTASLHQDQKQIQPGMRPTPTLNIFPSQPLRVNPPIKGSSGGLVSPGTSGSKRPSETTTSMELANQRSSDNHVNINYSNVASAPPAEPVKSIKREGNRKGPSRISAHDGPRTPDPKTLRRLAQNREAARKSRLRKKAYIQQLESSRIKLTQLEYELHRARSQGVLIGGGPVVSNEQGLPIGIGHISADAAIFNMEYARWLEEHHRLMCELRGAIQEHLPDNELQMFIENGLAHYDELMNLKGMVAKTDVFHLFSGLWVTPSERCFMWLGGFRPSGLIKVILNHIEPLSEQQILGICGLQQSTQEAEEALSQGLETLNQSLSDTISSDPLSYPTNMANYMGQMAAAMDKLSTLEGFIRQAEGLRHQTIHRLHQILTTYQSARCLLAIAEYFHRLRALSSLWLSRPRQD
ncbi:hypothetical protein MLD38_010262 [Melastoma candidum]|uniref:Uncharacterized protein n=1 Tax=Melastoma candidum TaxID=119954 RepID=A0ACB9R2T4_9MYRT|nr:hypothetical protein MLD38_010262 [Melastoma candidum]